MATKRSKKSLHVEKERILTRLKEIEEDRNYILQHVNKHFEQAEMAASSLLNETSRSKFLRKHHSVTQTLNDCWREIFRVKSHLVDNKEEEDDTSSSSSDESIGSIESEMSLSTLSCSSRIRGRSSVSAANSVLSPMSEECVVGDKVKFEEELQGELGSAKQMDACKTIVEEENGCCGDTCVTPQALDSSQSLLQSLPSPPCGDGLKNPTLVTAASHSSLPSTFPNVNCSEFVTGVLACDQAKSENNSDKARVLPSTVACADSSNTACDINKWTFWQSQIAQCASKLQLAIPESHSDGEESVNNSILSEHSMPSDRTIIGVSDPAAENTVALLSLGEQFISDANMKENKGTSIPEDICSSASTVTVADKNGFPLTHPPPPVAVANRRLISYGSSANSTCSSSSVDAANKLPSHTTSAESLINGSNDIFVENISLREGESIEGIVTALTSPSDLWIQVQDEHLGGLLEELNSFCDGSKSQVVGKELTEGHFCCAKCTMDDSWNRAVVQKIRYKPAYELNSNGAPNFVVESVDVRYIDYGNSEALPLDRLKRLRPKYVKLPAQAVCCLLGKLIPYTSCYEQWNAEVTNELREMVFGKEVRATIMKYCPGAASTVLLGMPDEDIDDVEDSLLRSLVAKAAVPNKDLGHEVSHEPSQVSSTSPQDDSKLAAKAAAKRMIDGTSILPIPPNDAAEEVLRDHFTWNARIEKLVPSASDGFYVIIAYVNSPSSFYVHMLPESAGYDALQKEMNETYAKAVDLKAPVASCVTANTCWAMKFSEDGQWYRVRVLKETPKAAATLELILKGDWRLVAEIAWGIGTDSTLDNCLRRRRRIALNPSENKLFVEYVDYGNCEWVSVESLRPLRKDHCNQPELAFHMRLAHIFPLAITPEQCQRPTYEWSWSENALNAFSQMIGADETLLARFVEDEEEFSHFGIYGKRDGDPLAIQLWDGPSHTINSLVNSDLVQGGFAMSLTYGPETQTGIRSTKSDVGEVYKPVRKYKT